jgi:hypothetical protein
MLAFSLPQLEGASIWIDLNEDGIGDEQITFDKSAFLLAWEDLPTSASGFDSDYNDTFFLITRIQNRDIPVTATPEPLTMALMGSGLLGMIGLRRKRA